MAAIKEFNRWPLGVEADLIRTLCDWRLPESVCVCLNSTSTVCAGSGLVYVAGLCCHAVPKFLMP